MKDSWSFFAGRRVEIGVVIEHDTEFYIIDDSVVVRRFLSDLLTSESDMEVAGIAHNGRIGLAKISQTVPDLVLLDLEMPEMDGLETLTEIRRQWPRLPVIMYSSLTQRGARATLNALEIGANDYVTKPKQMASPRRPSVTSGPT